jgi:hypothetical protein
MNYTANILKQINAIKAIFKKELFNEFIKDFFVSKTRSIFLNFNLEVLVDTVKNKKIK